MDKYGAITINSCKIHRKKFVYRVKVTVQIKNCYRVFINKSISWHVPFLQKVQ